MERVSYQLRPPRAVYLAASIDRADGDHLGGYGPKDSAEAGRAYIRNEFEKYACFKPGVTHS